MRFSSLLPFLLLLLSTSQTLSQSTTIPLGSTLSPTNPSSWSSPNQTFSFSFSPSPRNPSLFLASITYSGGIPVWSAGGAAAAVDSSASLQLLPDGNLVLRNGSGSLVWQSNTANLGVASADLDESGNLRLTNSSSTIWQSFDHPTDTLLQNQNFTTGKTLSSGVFSFFLQSSGNLTLKWNNSITYYNKGLNSSLSNTTLSSPVLTLQSNGIVTLFDSALLSSAVIAYSSDYGESDMMRFLRLDPDGNFRAYSATKGSSLLTDRWSMVSDQCEVFGWCGNMGICSYVDTSPVCSCPSETFDFVDPNDTTKGCKRRIEIEDHCQGNITMLRLDNVKFLTYPPEVDIEQFFVGITACETNCLSGRSCVTSTSLADGSGLCYLKVSNFVSGYQSGALPSTSFLKVCGQVDVVVGS